jgi:kinesin family protein C1
MINSREKKAAIATILGSAEASEVVALREKLRVDEEAFERLQAAAKNTIRKLRVDAAVMRNKYLDSRPNIRVFARVRPSIATESNRRLCVWNFPDESRLEVDSSNGGSRHNTFIFDRVFGLLATQLEIFDEVKPLIQSALDGYNVCILACGEFDDLMRCLKGFQEPPLFHRSD